MADYRTGPSDYQLSLRLLEDRDIAKLYQQYIEAPGASWFSDICYELDRRELSLEQVEELLLEDLT